MSNNQVLAVAYRDVPDQLSEVYTYSISVSFLHISIGSVSVSNYYQIQYVELGVRLFKMDLNENTLPVLHWSHKLVKHAQLSNNFKMAQIILCSCDLLMIIGQTKGGLFHRCC